MGELCSDFPSACCETCVTEDAVEFRLAGPDPGCGCVLDSPALTLRAVFVDFYRYFVRPLY